MAVPSLTSLQPVPISALGMEPRAPAMNLQPVSRSTLGIQLPKVPLPVIEADYGENPFAPGFVDKTKRIDRSLPSITR